ncbi:gamma-glutamyltransferase [Sneathiella sp. CAU 1612]|uniref:Glutathione hydrolase proenzyme n=1 Tax=Sneathiella sedimenti TaxID=2816034 RepID=A0ABS3F1F5_9PROT|nr:gamma-glutamyltransferase [Sneathiella sedimenti]MBO0332329.1 gamma-glutamyltransferase [Sneathiella sedimenti]
MTALSVLRIPAWRLLFPLSLVFLLLISPLRAETDKKYMIAAANPLAAEAGRIMLAREGSAVDAAIAVQMVLTLVEPQSSGIGGGAFLLHFDGETQKLETYDGRETAPAAVQETHFLTADGSPKKFYDAVVGGGSVGVPGVVAMLAKAHEAHGKLPWKDLFEPAIKLSEEGFLISPRLYYLLDRDEHLKTRATAGTYFYNADGSAKAVGTRLQNPALAATLRVIAANGPDAFYHGDIAQSIVNTVRSDNLNPGLLTLDDMTNYKAIKREPVCAPYRAYTICGMGPPTSGGVTLLQALRILEAWDMPAISPGSAEAIDIISQASALAFADRGKYLADGDFVDIPVRGLLGDAYVESRAKMVIPGESHLPFKAGNPEEKQGSLGLDNAIELPSTSHFSIRDSLGNAVSMTTSVENVFGSRLMTGGFILNNQLTDFSFTPTTEDGPVANRIEPNKRPRSSMSPTMVFDGEGKLRLVIGSPGGSRIIGYVLKTIVASLDWNMDLQTAIAMPHYINRNGTLDLEVDTPLADLKPELESMGYKVNVRTLNSGLHGISITGMDLQGGADPRREGIVLTGEPE